MNFKNNKNLISGFTLIELLVVIAIIGILSSVVLASLNSARVKANDTKRRSDARQITLAIELFFNTNGTYPVASGATMPNSAWANSSDSSWDTLASQLSPYLPSLPKDPKQTTDSNIWAYTGYAYSYVNCGKSYMFVYRTDEAKGPDNGGYCGGDLYKYGGAGANTNIKTLGSSY